MLLNKKLILGLIFVFLGRWCERCVTQAALRPIRFGWLLRQAGQGNMPACRAKRHDGPAVVGVDQAQRVTKLMDHDFSQKGSDLQLGLAVVDADIGLLDRRAGLAAPRQSAQAGRAEFPPAHDVHTVHRAGGQAAGAHELDGKAARGPLLCSLLKQSQALAGL